MLKFNIEHDHKMISRKSVIVVTLVIRPSDLPRLGWNRDGSFSTKTLFIYNF